MTQNLAPPRLKSANTIAISPKGIIELSFVGDQTEETLGETIVSIIPLAKDIESSGGKPLFLIDYGQMGKASIASRQRAMKAMKEIPFHKMAGINAAPVIKFITNTIASVTGNSHRARHFSNRVEAEQWLAEP